VTKDNKRFVRLYHAALGLLKDRLVNSYFTPDKFKSLLQDFGDPYSAALSWIKRYNLEN
jgi:hypothetical protein